MIIKIYEGKLISQGQRFGIIIERVEIGGHVMGEFAQFGKHGGRKTGTNRWFEIIPQRLGGGIVSDRYFISFPENVDKMFIHDLYRKAEFIIELRKKLRQIPKAISQMVASDGFFALQIHVDISELICFAPLREDLR